MNSAHREIEKYIVQNETLKTFTGGLTAWLTQHTADHGLNWLLAHADDGVIWGRYDDQQKALLLSSDVFPDLSPSLRTSTLQDARLFSPQGELLVWRTPDGFSSRLILDGDQSLTSVDAFEETHLLWGAAVKTEHSFTLMQEGANKLYHALPMALSPGSRVVLRVRHYLAYDQLGQAAVIVSRLVNLEKRGES